MTINAKGKKNAKAITTVLQYKIIKKRYNEMT